MRMSIEDTKTYKKLGDVAKLLVNKASSKRTIKDAVTIAKTIGIENWEKITPIPHNWKGIVKELAV